MHHVIIDRFLSISMPKYLYNDTFASALPYIFTDNKFVVSINSLFLNTNICFVFLTFIVSLLVKLPEPPPPLSETLYSPLEGYTGP